MAALAEIAPSDLADELTAHAVTSIETADYFSFPFPHIVFRNFFPADFYRDLIRSVPTQGYDPITDTGTRVALRLYGENIEKIDPALRFAWAAVSIMLTSKGVERAIRNRLHDGLAIRARGDKVPDADALKLIAKPVVYWDRDGYQIKPHPDTRKKVVTMQLYCPADISQEALGTTLYRASLKGLFHVGSYCLEPVKTIPFLPNVGYAFVVLKAYHSLTKMSWHGRPPIKTDQPRISILNTFYMNEYVGF
ncbi:MULTISPECIES: hypothetical protein [unclassified Bradyrhizobium]|uniref:hypothetical protein n=1 Tax=unclassified Bradyrhizobium TaxID=2631580 RepID=UPI0024787AD1|nr:MULTISPECIES: hypothetical protein [unclassified Bradyrhizobium]WGR69506.1 hypothetical protein MTX24_29355 [Bradyrhizobium sp. ISRA426]WGR81562.1 hypothetical protein MTX21_14465 [Bradyrhizobium sp. ISRA430]WGR84746.1 hypothetical protein MTX25_29030 [Bradyrhizobium sp. ISRA432]